MSRLLKVSLILIFGVLALAPAASAQRRVVILGGGPGFYGGGFYYGGGWPYGPYGYGYGPGYLAASNGVVKIETHRKDASVYIDGGYAGLTGKLKKFPLGPGNHDIEMRDPGGKTVFHERVRVIVGKTTDIVL